MNEHEKKERQQYCSHEWKYNPLSDKVTQKICIKCDKIEYDYEFSV